MKTQKTIGIAILVGIVVALVLAASIKVYIVRAPSGGMIFSKSDEAYLFLADTRIHRDSHPARVSTPKSSCGARARQSELAARNLVAVSEEF